MDNPVNNPQISDYGQVLSWLDGRKVPILCSPQEPKGSPGFASFTCAPQFGDTPEGMPWRLPSHGVVHSLTRADDRTHLFTRLCPPKIDNWYLRLYFLATTEFPWMYHVDLSVGYEPGLQQLTQAVVITRMPGCPNRELMPVSFGFHPCFALFGKEHLQLGRTRYKLDNLPPRLPLGHRPIKLRNWGRTISITARGDVDEWKICTVTGRYLCIKPVGGIQKPIRLERDAKVSGVCVIESRLD